MSAPLIAPGERLVVATHNAGKLAEFRDLLGPFGLDLTSAGELGLPEPAETGETFEDNALTKARSAAELSGLPALSDDSGLCVDALGGAPGIYTADWATQPDGSRDFGLGMEKVERALSKLMATTPDSRRGRFVAVLCLVRPGGAPRFWRGEAEGQLVWPPRGTLGFGFDPVFLPEGHTLTFGEMEAATKHGWRPGQASPPLSHRARAFARFAADALGAPA